MAHKTLHRAFNELLHPRDDRGRFTKKGTGSTKWVDKMIGKHDLNLGFTQDHAPKGRLPGGLLVNTPAKKRVAERAIESAGEHAGKGAGRPPGGSVVKRLDNSIAKPEHGGMPEKRSTSKLDRLEKQIEVQRGKVAMAKEARVNRGGRIQSSRETAATRKLHDLQVEASKERASQAAGPDAPRSGLAQVADDMHALHKEVFPDGVPDFAVGDKVHYNGSGLAVAPKEYTVSKKLPLGGLVLTRTDQNGREVNITVSPVDVQRDQTLTARAKASTEQARKEATQGDALPGKGSTPAASNVEALRKARSNKAKAEAYGALTTREKVQAAKEHPAEFLEGYAHHVYPKHVGKETGTSRNNAFNRDILLNSAGAIRRGQWTPEQAAQHIDQSAKLQLRVSQPKLREAAHLVGGRVSEADIARVEAAQAKKAAAKVGTPKPELPPNDFADVTKELGNKESAFNKQVRGEVAAKRAAGKLAPPSHADTIRSVQAAQNVGEAQSILAGHSTKDLQALAAHAGVELPRGKKKGELAAGLAHAIHRKYSVKMEPTRNGGRFDIHAIGPDGKQRVGSALTANAAHRTTIEMRRRDQEGLARRAERDALNSPEGRKGLTGATRPEIEDALHAAVKANPHSDNMATRDKERDAHVQAALKALGVPQTDNREEPRLKSEYFDVKPTDVKPGDIVNGADGLGFTVAGVKRNDDGSVSLTGLGMGSLASRTVKSGEGNVSVWRPGVSDQNRAPLRPEENDLPIMAQRMLQGYDDQQRLDIAERLRASKGLPSRRPAPETAGRTPGGGTEGNAKPTDAATLTLERAYAMHGTDEAAWSARTKRDMEKLRKAAGITTTPKVTANRPGRTPGGMANKVPTHNADGGNKLDRSLDGGDAGGMTTNRNAVTGVGLGVTESSKGRTTTVTLPDGTTAQRTSKSMAYTHAVVRSTDQHGVARDKQAQAAEHERFANALQAWINDGADTSKLKAYPTASLSYRDEQQGKSRNEYYLPGFEPTRVTGPRNRYEDSNGYSLPNFKDTERFNYPGASDVNGKTAWEAYGPERTVSQHREMAQNLRTEADHLLAGPQTVHDVPRWSQSSGNAWKGVSEFEGRNKSLQVVGVGGVAVAKPVTGTPKPTAEERAAAIAERKAREKAASQQANVDFVAKRLGDMSARIAQGRDPADLLTGTTPSGVRLLARELGIKSFPKDDPRGVKLKALVVERLKEREAGRLPKA